MPIWAPDVNSDVPSRPFSEENRADRPTDVSRKKKKHPVDPFVKTWVKSIRGARDGESQEAFAEALGAESRDAVAKWENGYREPSFTYTRRLAQLAPKAQIEEFLGISGESAAVSDPSATLPPDEHWRIAVKTTEAEHVALVVDGIDNKQERQRVLDYAQRVRDEIRKTVGKA